MPQYRKLRLRKSFSELLGDPDLAAGVSLYALKEFDPDGIIIFSDILTVLKALGAQVRYEPQLTVEGSVAGLSRPPREEFLSPAYRTLEILRGEVGDSKALIGFAGAPYTLFHYLSGRGYKPRAALIRNRGQAKETLEKIADAVALHLRLQAGAGSDVLQIFDSHAGELSPAMYEEFAIPPLLGILEKLADIECPIILFSRGRNLLDFRDRFPGCVLSLDWTVPFDSIPEAHSLAVQGNLDPAVLLAGPDITRVETERMLGNARSFGGFVANLGHGVLPDTPVESVKGFADAVKAWSWGN